MAGVFPPLPGPYRVGVVDFALTSERDETQARAAGRHWARVLRLCVTSVLRKCSRTQAFFRLYYPTEAPLASLPAWLPHWRYCRGYSQFVSSDLIAGPKPKKTGFARVLQAAALTLFELFVVVLGSLWHRLPVRPGAPLAPPSVSAPRPHGMGGTLPDARGAAPGAPAVAALPCLVLSHGLGGTRAAYAFHASALASSGRLVAAMEHGDATACLARIPPHAGGRHKGAWLLYGGCGTGAERWAKVSRRCSEMTLVLDLLCALAEQTPPVPLPHSPHLTWPQPPQPPPLGSPAPASGGDASAAFLEQFRGRVDTAALIAAGHSFGGGAAIAFARSDSRIAACVVNDPWMPACSPADAAATPWQHPVALLSLLCDDWTQSKLHDEAALARVRDAVRAGGGVAALAGQRATNHFSFSDVVFVIPHAFMRRLRPGFKEDPPPPPGPVSLATFALLDAFLRKHTGARRVTPTEARARADRFAALMESTAAGKDGDGEVKGWQDHDGHADMISKAFGDQSLGLMQVAGKAPILRSTT